MGRWYEWGVGTNGALVRMGRSNGHPTPSNLSFYKTFTLPFFPRYSCVNSPPPKSEKSQNRSQLNHGLSSSYPPIHLSIHHHPRQEPAGPRPVRRPVSALPCERRVLDVGERDGRPD